MRFLLLVFLGCSTYSQAQLLKPKTEIDQRVHSLINPSNLSVEQLKEIKKISGKDDNGFKYIKNKISTNKVKSTIAISNKNNHFTKEDEEKLKSIIKKYK